MMEISLNEGAIVWDKKDTLIAPSHMFWHVIGVMYCKTLLAYEFLGSAVVTYAFTLSNLDPLIRAIAYFIVYLLASHITGAHFNPATSLACYLTDRYNGKHTLENHRAALKQLLALMFGQVCGAYLGILVTFLLAKDYVLSIALFPFGNLYTYNDTIQPGTFGILYARIFAQEVLQTFIFTLIFLSFRGQTYFHKSNILVRGLTLTYVLYACYAFSYGAGACLNPALGLAQSTYMIARMNANDMNTDNRYAQTIWVYMTAPFVGAFLAALFNQYHQATTDQFEEEENRKHVQKLSESRSVDKIDVEDTRSRQEDLNSTEEEEKE